MIEPKELFGNDYSYFCEIDPYNPKNTVEGLISRKSTEYYGALIIQRINGKEVPEQLIMCTPKMNYPFVSRADGTRNYTFPTVKEIEIYEKLDGTNILAFIYTDGENRFLSFKTRLRPFLNAGSAWGNFFAMWNEVAEPLFKEIKLMITANNCNLAFELYGSRNPHLVMYKEPLNFALLFGVTNSGKIISPSHLVGIEKFKPLPVMKKIDKDYVWNYEALQKELNDGLNQIEDGFYTGSEGTVWYLHFHNNLCLQVKCKPDIIEAIHFSAGAKDINKQVILTTCWNALENDEGLNLEFVKTLLLEEFKPELVEASHYMIEKSIEFVKTQLEFRQRVLDEYKNTGLNIVLDKAGVMRALSTKFDKKDITKVYSTIRDFS